MLGVQALTATACTDGYAYDWVYVHTKHTSFTPCIAHVGGAKAYGTSGMQACAHD